MVETPVKNKRSNKGTKSPENKYPNIREVTIYKHREFVIVEVEKEKIDNIKCAVENAKNTIGKRTISDDIVLGFSTTFFGSFLGSISNIADILNPTKDSPQNAIQLIMFYFSLLLIAVILFVIYLSIQQNHHTTIISLIDTIKKETDSISNSLETPSNKAPEISPSNDRENIIKKLS